MLSSRCKPQLACCTRRAVSTLGGEGSLVISLRYRWASNPHPTLWPVTPSLHSHFSLYLYTCHFTSPELHLIKPVSLQLPQTLWLQFTPFEVPSSDREVVCLSIIFWGRRTGFLKGVPGTINIFTSPQ